ncbi:CBS domain-containing protein [Propionivibrio dicarboxylicus]|uniref:CBS domain-containing protein n=1 Tax=Propionivibrio dicarboxylicus TaxID=83767 RepID=A0A1G8KDA3_9RHOO|nr:CBS domain-containing protein [Propionivibrio dicarboxylicus]SDI41415.1 CBS domain-containing protein [Propionivibrio dicarboxylicus]
MGHPRHPRIESLTVGNLLAEEVRPEAFVAPEMRIADVLARMAQHRIDALAVWDGTAVRGVFSGQTWVQGCVTGVSPGDSVSAAMLARPLSVAPGEAVSTCLSLMQTQGCQYLAVIDVGRWVGLLSVEELQAALLRHYESIFREQELDQKIMFMQGTYSC